MYKLPSQLTPRANSQSEPFRSVVVDKSYRQKMSSRHQSQTEPIHTCSHSPLTQCRPLTRGCVTVPGHRYSTTTAYRGFRKLSSQLRHLRYRLRLSIPCILYQRHRALQTPPPRARAGHRRAKTRLAGVPAFKWCVRWGSQAWGCWGSGGLGRRWEGWGDMEW